MKTTYHKLLASFAFAGSLATGSPLEDLASPDQGIRDKAAAEQRANFKSTPESKWLPVIEGIHAGQTKGEILELLRPFKVTPEFGVGSGQSHSQSYRLDDEWTLLCAFRNEGEVLIQRSLERRMKAVNVTPPENFTGTWILYFVNGNKSHEISMKDGQYFGEFTAYHANGTKAYVQHYTKEGANGEDTGYHPSGKVAYRGQYKAGKQIGKWTWYDENGQITSTREFDDL